MDNSLITYQANYSDWRVAAIVDMIKKWRDGNQSPIYYLKNKASLFSMRNDHSPQRNFAEDYLHNLKRIDFSLLKHSVQQVRISHNLNSFRSLMKPVFNKLIKDKSLIVNKIIQQFRCDDDHEKRTSFMIASIEKGKGTLKPVSALDP